jgi:hypothetical protein
MGTKLDIYIFIIVKKKKYEMNINKMYNHLYVV